MTSKNINFPSNSLFFKQLNLSDFNFEKPAKNFIKRHLKNHNEDLTNNQLLKFIETTLTMKLMFLIWQQKPLKLKRLDQL